MPRLGDGAQAGALFDLLNPIFQADTPEKAADYRVEPYVIVRRYLQRAALPAPRRLDLVHRLGRLDVPPGAGSHARAHTTGGNTLRIDPVIPPDWDGFEITYRFGQATYQIKVINPRHVASGVRGMTLDGKLVEEIRMEDDGQEHQVEVVMGEEK